MALGLRRSTVEPPENGGKSAETEDMSTQRVGRGLVPRRE